MFCPESSLSLLQVDVGGEKNVILISGGGKKIQISPLFTLKRIKNGI